jgi:glycerol-3-phosphate acyltransferase PlsY
MAYLFCVSAGYLVGMINPSYILGKCYGVDVRCEGSGNAGASNALMVMGKMVGVLCALFDIAKATLCVHLMQWLFGTKALIFAVTSVACVLGHIYPIYMKFRGGKGLACLGGVILAFDWRIFLIMLAAELVLVLLVDYICFVPITASVIFPLVYGLMRGDLAGALILCVLPIVVFVKHLENIRRIKAGSELHFSYLWKKDAEIARIQADPDDFC